MDCNVGDESADGSESDDSESLAVKLDSSESGLALFDRLGDVFAAVKRFCPRDSSRDVARSERE